MDRIMDGKDDRTECEESEEKCMNCRTRSSRTDSNIDMDEDQDDVGMVGEDKIDTGDGEENIDTGESGSSSSTRDDLVLVEARSRQRRQDMRAAESRSGRDKEGEVKDDGRNERIGQRIERRVRERVEIEKAGKSIGEQHEG